MKKTDAITSQVPDASDRNSRTPRISGYGEAKGASTPEYSIARRWSRVKVERSISGGPRPRDGREDSESGRIRSGRVESSRPPRLMLVAVATTPAVTDIYTIVAIASHIPLQANARGRAPSPLASPPPRLSFSVRPSDFLGCPRPALRLRAAVPPLAPLPFPRVLFLRGSFNRLPSRAHDFLRSRSLTLLP